MFVSVVTLNPPMNDILSKSVFYDNDHFSQSVYFYTVKPYKMNICAGTTAALNIWMYVLPTNSKLRAHRDSSTILPMRMADLMWLY